MNNTTCFIEQISSATAIILSVWHSLSALIAVSGNLAVLWLFYKNKLLRTISNRLITSLSAADLLVGLVFNPVWIAMRCWTKPTETHFLFKVTVLNVLWIHSTACTTFNLCCVSVDRFIAIRFPFQYQDILTKKRCHTVIIFAWIASLLLPLSLVLVHDNHERYGKLRLSLSAITFLVPTTVVTFCYCWIFKVARKQMRVIRREYKHNAANKQTKTHQVKQNFKALKTVGRVLGVFVISWMPCLVVSIVYHFVVKDQCSNNLLYFAVLPWVEVIAFTSSAINPWIYCFRNSDFREALHRSFVWFPAE